MRTDRGQQVGQRILPSLEALHAPHLIDLEIAQVLRRQVARRYLTDAHAKGAVEYWADLTVVRHSHAPYLERIWELRQQFTAYDAVYLSLAERLGVPLLTCDRKLLARGHDAQIELVAQARQA